MALPKFLQPYLASYNLTKLDPKKDKKLIITEVLNKGDYQALRWLGRAYSQKEIKKAVSSPTRGMWMKSVLSYWLKIFDIKLKKGVLKTVVVDLNKF